MRAIILVIQYPLISLSALFVVVQEREAAVPEQGEVPPATAPVADPQL